MKNGKVYLVGAGPGDPGLLTMRAAELIGRADLVALDALVSPDIAARIPKSTEVVYVGKRASAHALPQDQINQLLVSEAKKGKMVVPCARTPEKNARMVSSGVACTAISE